MSANFNRVILAGNLTRDPELRYTPNGTAIAKIGLAINEKWKGADGQMNERTVFVDVDCFGKQAEVIGQYLKKGRPILIEGRLKLDEWTDKATQKKRQRLGVVMESFQFLGSAKKDSEAGADEAGEPVSRPAGGKKTVEVDPEAMPPIEDDDVPF